MMKLSIGYPSKEEDLRLAKNELSGKTVETVESVIKAEDVLKIREEVSKVLIKDEVLSYIREIIDLTRHEPRFVLGASPRAMLSIMRASQGHAYLDGRDFVKPDDVKAVAVSVLSHRLVLTSEARIGKEDTAKILSALSLKAKVPIV